VSRLAERLERRTLFATTVFTIDPALSAITLSGDAAGFGLKRQDDGSLKARYEGQIVADYVANSSIRFLGGSDVVAETRGRYDPGDAPGNYAAEVRQLGVTVFEGVARRLRLDLLSDPLAVANGSFASTRETVRVTGGRFSYDLAVGNDDSFDLAGKQVNNRTATASTVVTGADGITRLTIPVDVTYKYDSANAQFHLKGQVVATAGPDAGLRPRVDANGSTFGTGFSGVFTTGPSAVAVPAVASDTDDGLTVSDFDSPTLTGATVSLLTHPDGAAEVLAVVTTGTPVAASFDSAAGVLTLSGDASPAVYQQVLRTLTYDNDAATPTPGDRTARIVVSDSTGAGPAADSVVSVEEPFSPNTARLGDGQNKSVTFTDADGTVTTIGLAGGGTATVRFEGATDQTTQNGRVVVTGTGVRLLSITATGTGPLSRLSVKTAGGNGATDLPAATVEGTLASFGGKGLNATGTFDFGARVRAAAFRDITGATVSAPSIGKLAVAGAITNSTLALSDPFSAALQSLGKLAVRGAITDSRIDSGGTIGSIKAARVVNSGVYAGIVSADRFPADATAFANDASILRLSLKSAAGTSAFDNSVVAGRHLGKIALGVVDTDNGGTPFGLLADTIASVAATGPTGQKLKLSKLDDPAVLSAALPGTGFTFGDLQIRLV
jgi:hypothetical protein